jgi:protoporphyrinogen oxidase
LSKTAIIIGAGPAGLTAAYELVTRTDIKPIIIEKSNDIGGISKTVVHNGNRIDIGGHRFFSKSDLIMKWWQEILPIQDPLETDRVMLIRNRLSRIFFLRRFFDYPISFNRKTLAKLGIVRIIRIAWTYGWIRLFPIKNINSLEDFFISRFGKELYITFFKDYTEKVWGKPCSEMKAEWGVQRVKGLSVSKAIYHSVRSVFKKGHSFKQNNTETSLIEKFMFPKLGAGQMWETVAEIVEEKGGIIIKNSEVVGLNVGENHVSELTYLDRSTNLKTTLKSEYFFSTMPVKDLIIAMGSKVPAAVKMVSDGLQFRDFITVGLLLNKLKIKNETKTTTFNNLVPDNWIYIQERDVKVCRLQIFNNWSPYMVADINKVWIGLEYFCSEGDELWKNPDNEFIKFAIEELHSIDIIDKDDVIDSTLLRVPKAYPAYFGTYSQFDVIKDFTDKFENLFLIGRNGMHKYNNQDHSMLTAMTAVNIIISGEKSKSNIWNINTEEEYHESKQK